MEGDGAAQRRQRAVYASAAPETCVPMLLFVRQALGEEAVGEKKQICRCAEMRWPRQ